jgi:hypothetical protein
MKGLITASAFAGSLSSRAMKVVQIVARCTDPSSVSTVVLLVRSTSKLFATDTDMRSTRKFCSPLEPALLSRPVNIRCDRPMSRAVVIVPHRFGRIRDRRPHIHCPACFEVHGVIADVDGGNRLYNGDKRMSSLGLRAEASEREMPRACDADDDEFRRAFASVLGGAVSALCSRTNECPATPSFLPLPAPQTLSAPSDIYPRPTFDTTNTLTKDLLPNKPLSSPKTTKKLIPNKLSKMGALDVVPVSFRLG